jgi:branched-chain amino acid transport system ATP-binding protein
VSAAALLIEDVSAGYGGSAVVRGLSLSIDAGEVVALLGANGAGKTTTLRVVSGLVQATSGAVSVFGEDVASMSPRAVARLGVAHMPEGRGVFSGLTVAEHFRLAYRGETIDVEGALAHFPALETLWNRRVGLLSGGEQQMVALARALARKPRLLLIDELSLGLAPLIVERLLPTVRDYAAASGAAVLLVEQHVRLALQVADRGYVLSRGEIVHEDTAERLSADRHLLVGSYLGESGGATRERRELARG